MQNKPLSFSVDIKLRKSNSKINFDFSIILTVIVLSLFGLAMIYSASGSTMLLYKQGIYFLIGMMLMFIAAISNFRKMEPIYLNGVWVGFFFLILVLILPNSGTTNRWINIGFIGFQPSELMRFLLPISAAAYLSRNPQIKFSDWLVVAITTLIAFLLVFFQPDFGTSAIVLLSGLVPIVLSGMPWPYIFYSFLAGLAVLPFLWMSLLDYQRERVFTFFSPDTDVLGSGWNIAQSKIAIGSGQFLGKGFSEGSQSQLDFIPESHTDFIFAVIVEEFGFLGALILFLLYAFLIHRLLYGARMSNSKFAKLVAGTLSIILAAYITLNISMVVGIFPVVGMPLPFISQGGTALVVNMITIGIILSLRRTN